MAFFKKRPANVQPDYLIVGLGNPGPQYARTRHNVGFDVIQVLAAKHKIRLDVHKHKAQYGLGTLDGLNVVLAKPLTFMNLSGQAVAAIARQYGIKPERILVVADDLDLPVGKAKMKPKGSSGGHKGHKSIIESLGTEEYPRIKIGIGKGGDTTIDHVLSRFTPDERQAIEDAIRTSVTGCEVFVAQGLERALNTVNAGTPSD